MVHETVSYLHDWLETAEVKSCFVEGANATKLDIDSATSAMVTSSNCSIGVKFTGICASHRRSMRNCEGFSKRVGSGCSPSELQPDLGELIRTRGLEYGVTTGGPRRCGWLDMAILR